MLSMFGNTYVYEGTFSAMNKQLSSPKTEIELQSKQWTIVSDNNTTNIGIDLGTIVSEMSRPQAPH